jgi:hypothetical protein
MRHSLFRFHLLKELPLGNEAEEGEEGKAYRGRIDA